MGRPRHLALDRARYYTRHAGLISEAFHARQVVLVGANGASPLALALGRLGPGALTVIDPELIEVENLARSSYGVADLGRPKAEVIAELVRRANPFVAASGVVADVTQLPPDAVRAVAAADLLLDCTDSFTATAHINRLSLMFKKPAIFAGLFAGALGGHIVWQLPGQGACYRCLSAKRYAAAQADSDKLALTGASATIADIGFLDAIVLRLAVALLERDQPSPFGAFFRQLGNRQDVFVRTHPDFCFPDGTSLFDAVLADLPTTPKDFAAELKAQAFFACDSLWLQAERNPVCPDCGHLYPKETAS